MAGCRQSSSDKFINFAAQSGLRAGWLGDVRKGGDAAEPQCCRSLSPQWRHRHETEPSGWERTAGHQLRLQADTHMTAQQRAQWMLPCSQWGSAGSQQVRVTQHISAHPVTDPSMLLHVFCSSLALQERRTKAGCLVQGIPPGRSHPETLKLQSIPALIRNTETSAAKISNPLLPAAAPKCKHNRELLLEGSPVEQLGRPVPSSHVINLSCMCFTISRAVLSKGLEVLPFPDAFSIRA